MNRPVFSYFVKLIVVVVFLSSCNHSDSNVRPDEPFQKKSLSFNPRFTIGGGPEGKSANPPANTSQKPKFSDYHYPATQTVPKKMAIYCSKRNKNTCYYIRGNMVYANGRGGMTPTHRTVNEITNSKRSGFEFIGFGYYKMRQR